MQRVYLRWPICVDKIELVNEGYADRGSPCYGVDEESRWYVDVPDEEWAAALRLIVSN